ncbi:unnamed protein product [Trichogramma brassicae]|uniref:Uncharacterized protein n=1 Tax=Trichogramma brassicae TaxID=86971 RepID=A0A6H5INE4_9HYME|nr:unnamed protein product [Trichogramma brassicae]
MYLCRHEAHRRAYVCTFFSSAVLTRSWSDIKTGGRPLSASSRLRDLFFTGYVTAATRKIKKSAKEVRAAYFSRVSSREDTLNIRLIVLAHIREKKQNKTTSMKRLEQTSRSLFLILLITAVLAYGQDEPANTGNTKTVAFHDPSVDATVKSALENGSVSEVVVRKDLLLFPVNAPDLVSIHRLYLIIVESENSRCRVARAGDSSQAGDTRGAAQRLVQRGHGKTHRGRGRRGQRVQPVAIGCRPTIPTTRP